jgi:hypothetical protein
MSAVLALCIEPIGCGALIVTVFVLGMVAAR